MSVSSPSHCSMETEGSAHRVSSHVFIDLVMFYSCGRWWVPAVDWRLGLERMLGLNSASLGPRPSFLFFLSD